jgi:serine/threonine protein kinase
MTGTLSSHMLVGGRYRIVRLLGTGGFGAVYEATDERFQARRVVAIKEMSDAHLSALERVQALQDFRHEADLLVPLSHPNLPHVSDFFEEANKAYLVMEYIEGKTLDKVQREVGGPLDEGRVMSWALQLCEVLNYLHTRQPPIIFRDLKPSNAMVTQDEQIKLIDFGIARIFKPTAQTDTASLGSQGYAPLEQYGRGRSDTRSDIYALGATLYALLTGVRPLDARTRRMNPSLFELPHQLNPRISQMTETIVLKAMHEDSDQRYQSVLEMCQAILGSGMVKSITTSHSLTAFPVVTPLSPVQSLPDEQADLERTLQSAPIVSSAPKAEPIASGGSGSAVGTGSQVQIPDNGGQPPVPVSRRKVIIGGALAVAGAITGFTYFVWRSSGAGSAPVGTININFFFTTEKQAWMQDVITTFNQIGATYQGKAIQINSSNSGSIDLVNKIMSGEIRPTAWSPASDLELNHLSLMWRAAHPGPDIIINSGDMATTSLVSSPLVLACWQERANALLRHYPSIDWPSLNKAFSLRGWSDLHENFPGLIKFGHTAPDKSNSGLLTIILLAYAALDKSRDLTVKDVNTANYVNFLKVFENAVNEFGRSSGTYLNKIVLSYGPALTDVIATYENLVLFPQLQQEAQQRYNQPLLLFYPNLNILSNHPFAIFQAPWVTPEQQAAALQFRNFLLDVSQQRRAVQNGFRPSNPNVQISDKAIANNPFAQLPRLSPKHTFDAQTDQLAFFPDGEVVNALIKLWEMNYPSPQLANG